MIRKKPWNKGLTKETDERIKLFSEKLKGKNKHWLGRHHTKEQKENIKESVKKVMNNPLMKERIRQARYKQILPMKDTTIEIKIQNFLKQLGISFMTHQYIKDIEHGYQCDIFIPSMKMVIECDGDYWHKYPIGNEIDHIRTSELLQKGFKVLRLWEREIKIIDIQKFHDIIQKGGLQAK